MTLRRLHQYVQLYTLITMRIILSHMPGWLASGIGRLAGGIAYCILPAQRRRSISNMEQGLNLSYDRARSLTLRCARHLGETWAENGYLWNRFNSKTFRDYLTLDGEEHVIAAKKAGRGAVFLTGHIGNWELGGMTTAYLWGKFISMANLGTNDLISDYIIRFREQDGQFIVGRKGAMSKMIRHLRQKGAIGIVVDLDARRHGIAVPFFGRLASSTPTPARLALDLDVPILIGAVHRVGTMRFHYTVKPLTWDARKDFAPETALRDITLKMNQGLEDLIRMHPEQWPWSHPRWETGDRVAARDGVEK